MSRNDIYKRAHNNVLVCTRIGMTYKQIAEEAATTSQTVGCCFNYDTWAQHEAYRNGSASMAAIERIANLNLAEMEKKYVD